MCRGTHEHDGNECEYDANSRILGKTECRTECKEWKNRRKVAGPKRESSGCGKVATDDEEMRKSEHEKNPKERWCALFKFQKTGEEKQKER